jgi:DNA replication protein DnaC
MLMTPTLDKLHVLKLHGMRKALEEQTTSSAYEEMSFADRVSLLVEREAQDRENRNLATRISRARFKEQAVVENIKPGASRGLDKTTLATLSQCAWVRARQNIIITGASGVGKTYLASALSHKACLLGHSVLYTRSAELNEQFRIGRVDGSFRKVLGRFIRPAVLIVDDWALYAMGETEQKDFFELVEGRHQSGSTILTSQTPVASWHGLMENPTLADAVLDRLVHTALRLELKGESMRKSGAACIDTEAMPKP